LPIIYIFGLKCVQPAVRYEALNVLRRQAIRGAVGDSMTAARVVERVVEVEDRGSAEG
ncbi:hypothetical protein BD289DRAFT_341582, partial [Coniella lustricola]